MTLPQFTLQGQVALVTGGSRGIGRAIALAYAEAGADVAICARNLPDLEKVAGEIRARGRRSLPVQANIAVKADVDDMVARTVQDLGTLDILVNNAAMNIMAPLTQLREDGWDKVMGVDLKGYYLCSQAAAKVMVEKKKGCIINISSVGGTRAEPALGAYSIAKAGVIMLTRVLALEMARHQVRVNCIGPSMVKTKFSQPLWATPEVLKTIESRVPLGRMAEPEDIVGAALFLASEASSYITGQTIFVDGGVMA